MKDSMILPMQLWQKMGRFGIIIHVLFFILWCVDMENAMGFTKEKIRATFSGVDPP
jgi:hypothetical protein